MTFFDFDLIVIRTFINSFIEQHKNIHVELTKKYIFPYVCFKTKAFPTLLLSKKSQSILK